MILQAGINFIIWTNLFICVGAVMDRRTTSIVEEVEARAIRVNLEATTRRGISKAHILSDFSILVDNLRSRALDLPP